MKNICILDATLRDGGYCINWNFGTKNIVSIIESLANARIDIIECGYLSSKNEYTEGLTIYSSLENIYKFLQTDDNNKFVVMVNYGEVDINNIPECCGTGITGIRVAFRKTDYNAALSFCRELIQKGYMVYVQPMHSIGYSNVEFSDLIQKVKQINPYAFYIVDSFGSMTTKDLTRLFYLADNELSTDIKIGFHAHNNMQMAFSNAQYLLNLNTQHDLIIDSCIMGMGRGAGNINTELLAEYLNLNCNGNYSLKPIIYTIDNIINNFYSCSPWGYSLPNYLSAKYNLHPNYASFLCQKNTLSLDDIDEIFLSIYDEKKDVFDIDYINMLYLKHMERGVNINDRLGIFAKQIIERNIFIIAPGSSSKMQKDVIIDAVKKENGIVISINHLYEFCNVDYVFFSNRKRFNNFDNVTNVKTIVTSNIFCDDAYIKVDYMSLINSTAYVSDNAGLMIIKFLLSIGVRKVNLCGYDGFSDNIINNYANKSMVLNIDKHIVNMLNLGMKKMISEYMKEIDINFITTNSIIQ